MTEEVSLHMSDRFICEPEKYGQAKRDFGLFLGPVSLLID